MTKSAFRILALCIAVSFTGQSLAAEPDESPSTPSTEQAARDETKPQQDAPTGKGVAAMQAAAKADKYLFALFYKEDDENTEKMREVLSATMKQIDDRAQSVEVNVSSESEQVIVSRFGLRWAPSPLLLAIAPNGVVTAGFPTRAETEELLDAFASPAMEKLLKALDERKLVFVCVQNAESEQRKAAMRGIRKFKRDERFADGTAIIKVDPKDKAEAELLESLQIDPQTPKAVTVFFGPQGRPIGQFDGETDFDELVHALTASMSGFG